MRMQDAKTALAGILLFFAMAVPSWAPAWAEEEPLVSIGEIVVTASRVRESVAEAVSDVIIIKKEDIEKTNALYLSDVLRLIPELNVVQTGGPGALATIFLRGGAPKHTLVLIDGVKANNPATGEFDFSALSLDDIERIEIVKGSQSTAYGSDAMAGVINVITRKGSGALNVNASFEGGSFATYKPSVSVSGAWKAIDYRLTGSYLKTDGISAAKSGDEADGHEDMSFSGKIGFKTTSKSDIELTGGYSQKRSDLDGFDYFTYKAADDLNYEQQNDRYNATAKGRVFLMDKWEQILTYSIQRDSLEGEDPDDSFNNYRIETGKDVIDWQHNVYENQNVLTAGVEYATASVRNTDTLSDTEVFDEGASNKAAYARSTIKGGELTVHGGARYDIHETAGEKLTYKVGASEYRREAGMTFRASYGTAFRAPTLNELYYPGYGSIDLKPEESIEWELGMDKAFSRATISATYFDQSYENLIETDPLTWIAVNIAEAKIRGVETELGFRLTDTIGLKAGYTYTDAKNPETDEKLPWRHRDKVASALSYDDGRLNVLLSHRYIGERFDPATQEDLDPYGVLDMSGAIKLTKNFSITARAVNLLDEDYSEAGGYGAPGRSFYGGIKASF